MPEEELKDPESKDMGQKILKFKKIAQNPLSRLILKNTLAYCQKDRENRLKVAVETYLNKRENCCWNVTLVLK